MKKILICILLILTAVVCSAGCTDDTPERPVAPTVVPTQPVVSTPQIEGTWYAQNAISYTDVYGTTEDYDVKLVFNSDNTGNEQWTSVYGITNPPYGFTWMKNGDGSYTIFYDNDYPLAIQSNQSKLFYFSLDGLLIDEDVHYYQKSVVTHMPTPTPEPTARPIYLTDKIDKIRGAWKTSSMVPGPSDVPCRLEYDFNRDGSGVEIWIATENVGSQQPGPILTYNFKWEQSTSGSTEGTYIVTMEKGYGDDRYTEVHQFYFVSADFSNLCDERGFIYLK